MLGIHDTQSAGVGALIAVIVCVLIVVILFATSVFAWGKDSMSSRGGHSWGTSNFLTAGNNPMWRQGGYAAGGHLSVDEHAETGPGQNVNSFTDGVVPTTGAQVFSGEYGDYGATDSKGIGSSCAAPSWQAQQELAMARSAQSVDF